MEIKMDLLPVFVQQPQRKQEAHRLPDHRCQRSALRAHLHRADKQDIQDHVQYGSDGDKHERMLGIPHAAQDRAHQVIPVDEHHAPDAGDAVLAGIFPDIFRGVQPPQDFLVGKQEDDHDNHGQAFQQGKQRADHVAHLVIPPGAHIPGNQDLSCVGKAHSHKGDQHQHFAADGNGGQAARADKVADHDHIHHVVDHLQESGQEQRQ